MNIDPQTQRSTALIACEEPGVARNARNALQEAVDLALNEAKHYRREFSSVLWEMSAIVGRHERQYRNLPECRDQILDTMAGFLAATGLPLKTDYSYVDPTGKQNALEEKRYQEWKRLMPSIVLDPADLPELGKRTIALLSKEFAEQTALQLPQPYDDHAYRFLVGVVSIKRELLVTVTAEDSTLIQSLSKSLPALIAEGCYGTLLHYFPEVFDQRPQVINQAKSEYLSRALQEVEVRWYGDVHTRISRLLNTKQNLDITESAADKEVAFQILAREWAAPDDLQQRIVEAFNFSPAELKHSVITGLCRQVGDWTFEINDADWYTGALKSLRKVMATHEISSHDLSFDPVRKIPVILNTGSPELTHAYFRTFGLPFSLLASEEFQPQTINLLETTLGKATNGTEPMPTPEYRVFEQFYAEGLKGSITIALQNVGNRILEESGVYGLNKLIEYIHRDPTSFGKDLFIEGAKRAVHSDLSNGDLGSARSVARKFNIDLKSPEFRASAISGITTIFERADGGYWNKTLFEEFSKECNLKGAIDDSRLREAIKPVIIAELSEASPRALNMVSWLLNRFRFNEPMPGTELREATLQSISSAICSSNGPAIRMLCNRVSSELTMHNIADVVKSVWHTSEGKKGCLENLRYLPESVKHQLNRTLGLADYERDLGVAGPITYDRYMEFRSTGRDLELKGFIKAVRKEMDLLITSEAQDMDILHSNPRYRELILTIFPNNWGPDASYEATESCQDRSSDLSHFHIRNGQGFTLAEGVLMRIKDGLQYDDSVALEIDDLINRCLVETATGGYSQIALRSRLLKDHGLESSYAKSEMTFQSAIFSKMLKSLAGNSGPLPLDEMLIKHRLVEFADVRNFMRGTRSRVEQAPNIDYANLLELQSFFGDHLRESINQMVRTALKDDSVRTDAQQFYSTTSKAQVEAQRDLIINKFRPDRLGLSDYFREQCLRELKKEGWESAEPHDVDTLIETFEKIYLNQPVDQKMLSTFSEKFIKKMSAIVASHRERTQTFLREIGYEQIQGTLLSEIDITNLISRWSRPAVAFTDSETLEAYFTELLHRQCNPLIDAITNELQKFEAEIDVTRAATRRRVNCFITKNHTSAHARKTAGVCVSIDNPARSGIEQKNLWDMSNYFQMVLQDDDKKTCLGLVLLHVYEDTTPQGKRRILSASYNPSSTFLYQVNERELFAGLHTQLEQFVIDNAIDLLTINKSPWIRTNRTGGEFESAIKEKVASINETVQLSRPEPFCHAYTYQNDVLDITWKRLRLFQRMAEKITSWWTAR